MIEELSRAMGQNFIIKRRSGATTVPIIECSEDEKGPAEWMVDMCPACGVAIILDMTALTEEMDALVAQMGEVDAALSSMLNERPMSLLGATARVRGECPCCGSGIETKGRHFGEEERWKSTSTHHTAKERVIKRGPGVDAPESCKIVCIGRDGDPRIDPTIWDAAWTYSDAIDLAGKRGLIVRAVRAWALAHMSERFFETASLWWLSHQAALVPEGAKVLRLAILHERCSGRIDEVTYNPAVEGVTFAPGPF